MKAQEWLNNNYLEEGRGKVEELNIKGKGLEGDLDLRGFVNLRKLNCQSNKLLSLNVDGCLNIEEINAWSNQISKVVGSEKLVNLKEVNLGANKLEELNLTGSPELFRVVVHTNQTKVVEVGDTRYLTHYVGERVALSWESVSKKELNKIMEELGINSEQFQGVSKERVKEVIKEKIEELKNKIKQAEQFGLTEWDNFTEQTQNETLNSLLELKDELEKAKEELSKRPNTTHDEYERLRSNQKPNNWKEQLDRIAELENRPSWGDYNKIVEEKNARPDIRKKEDWEDDYSQRPTRVELDRIKTELDKIKGLLGLNGNDALPNDWENRLTNKNDLDKANQKLRDYENDLKDKLDLTNETLSNWKDKIDKLKNRPTSDNSGSIKGVLGLNPADNLPNNWPDRLAKKDELEAAQNSLKEWEEKFNKAENENQKVIDNLKKELENWKSKLNNWQNRFSATPEELEKEINELKSQVAGAEKQKTIDSLKKVIEGYKALVIKCKDELRRYENIGDYNNQIEELSKTYQKLL